MDFYLLHYIISFLTLCKCCNKYTTNTPYICVICSDKYCEKCCYNLFPVYGFYCNYYCIKCYNIYIIT